MTEKQYKLERWTDTSLYYSFPSGSVHQSIGYVIEKVEKDLNQLAEENEQLKQREKTLEGMIRTFDEGCKEIYDDKCRLEKENEQLRKQNEELINGMQETARLSANAITKTFREIRLGKGVDYD